MSWSSTRRAPEAAAAVTASSGARIFSGDTSPRFESVERRPVSPEVAALDADTAAIGHEGSHSPHPDVHHAVLTPHEALQRAKKAYGGPCPCGPPALSEALESVQELS